MGIFTCTAEKVKRYVRLGYVTATSDTRCKTYHFGKESPSYDLKACQTAFGFIFSAVQVKITYLLFPWQYQLVVLDVELSFWVGPVVIDPLQDALEVFEF